MKVQILTILPAQANRLVCKTEEDPTATAVGFRIHPSLPEIL